MKTEGVKGVEVIDEGTEGCRGKGAKGEGEEGVREAVREVWRGGRGISCAHFARKILKACVKKHCA